MSWRLRLWRAACFGHVNVGAGWLGLFTWLPASQGGFKNGEFGGEGGRLVQALVGVVQVDVVRRDEVVPHREKAWGARPAQTARSLAVSPRGRQVLILEVGVHGNVALESLLAGRAHEGKRPDSLFLFRPC